MFKKIAAALIFLVLAFSLTACSFEREPAQLSAPANLKISANYARLTWNKVLNANGYLVIIDDEIFTAETNKYSLSYLTTPGDYIIKVQALGDGVKYFDSEWSEPKTYIVTEKEEKEEFNEELELQIKQSYIDFFNESESTVVVIENFYGIYNGSVALVIYSGFGYILNLFVEYVAGIKFVYGSSVMRIYIWNDGEFYTLPQAYDQGLLTQENVEKIYLNKIQQLYEEKEPAEKPIDFAIGFECN